MMSDYRVPEEFATRLHDAFDGRLRARWSRHTHCWCIEQKVRPSLAALMPAMNDRDDLVRRRDGYLLIMEVRPGDRMPCPTCGTTLKVPINAIGVVTCDFCYNHNNTFQYYAGHFELGDRLIEHLRFLDPTTGGWRRGRNRVDRNNARNEQSQERAVINATTSALAEDFNSIAGIPVF